jgi:hypothetical protein
MLRSILGKILPQGHEGYAARYGDLTSPLLRFPGLPKSILLPQNAGWDVANYLPMYVCDRQGGTFFSMTEGNVAHFGATYAIDSTSLVDIK